MIYFDILQRFLICPIGSCNSMECLLASADAYHFLYFYPRKNVEHKATIKSKILLQEVTDPSLLPPGVGVSGVGVSGVGEEPASGAAVLPGSRTESMP
jgi:hypothetical protein